MFQGGQTTYKVGANKIIRGRQDRFRGKATLVQRNGKIKSRVHITRTKGIGGVNTD